MSFKEFLETEMKPGGYLEIKDDEQIQSLIQELYKYKDDLRYGEDEHGQRRREGFKLRDAIYQRAKEILDEKEFNVFFNRLPRKQLIKRLKNNHSIHIGFLHCLIINDHRSFIIIIKCIFNPFFTISAIRFTNQYNQCDQDEREQENP